MRDMHEQGPYTALLDRNPIANVSMLQDPLYVSPRPAVLEDFNGGSIHDPVRYPAKHLFLLYPVGGYCRRAMP